MSFREEFDLINNKHNIEDTKNFLASYLENAIKNKNDVGIIECLNEAIGFYRDIEEFDISVNYSKSLYELLNKIHISKDALFISYINIANSYRAANMASPASYFFNEALNIYKKYELDNKYELASLYNNYGLLLTNSNKNLALEEFNNALSVLKEINNELRIGITYVNIANIYLKDEEFKNVKKYLDLAEKIFDKYQNDFHYSYFLALKAKYLYLTCDNFEAITYYKKALRNIDKFQGKTKTYFDLLDEYKNCLDGYGGYVNLIDISKVLFDEMFKDFPSDLLNDVVIGLFGYGSECNYLDDYKSYDHDFEPGFIILYKDDLDEKNVLRLKEFYNRIPEFYEEFYIRKISRHGVFKYSSYLESIGIKDINNIGLESLNLLTNGKIFYQGFDDFKHLRTNEITKYRLHIYDRLANNILEINQLIYNIDREKDRENDINSKYLIQLLTDKFIFNYFLANKIIPIHDKERLKMISKSCKHYKLIKKLVNNKYAEVKEDIINILLKELKKFGLIKNINSSFIEDYRDEILINKENYLSKLNLSKQICDIEWEMHQKLNSVDGIVECQTNDSYYKIMRISQHINMSISFLESYLNDLNYAKENGLSLPFIKYAFMEETTNKEMYEKVKDYLPIISEKRKMLQENIISLQLEMFEKYLKKNKIDKDKMRTIYTSTDSAYNASYETYLRAELSSYSEKSVMEYGLNLVQYSKNKINFVEIVVNTSKYLYE